MTAHPNSDSSTFVDAQYGTFVLSPLAVRFVHTRHFQRLRRLKQLGLSNYQFPGAVHTRFEHSLGVAYRARRFAEHIDRQQPELEVTPYDIQVLELAGLLHDLGHGPFSHTFENEILPRLNPDGNWAHEEMSAQLVQHCVQTCHLQDAVSDSMVRDVCDVIAGAASSPSFQGRRKWMLQVVANPFNGVDVDRCDYLQRDARATGHHVQWDLNQLGMSCCRVDEAGDIVWGIEAVGALEDLFKARHSMHQQVYQHPRTKAVEAMVADALVAAEPVLRLSERCSSSEDFLELDDELLRDIRTSRDPALATAQQLLQRIERGQLYHLAAELQVPPAFAGQAQWAAVQQLINEVQVLSCSSRAGAAPGPPLLAPADIWVSCIKIDFGSGSNNPMDTIKLERGQPYCCDHLPRSFLQRRIRVYLKHHGDSQQHVRHLRGAFAAWAEQVFGTEACKGRLSPPPEAPLSMCAIICAGAGAAAASPAAAVAAACGPGSSSSSSNKRPASSLDDSAMQVDTPAGKEGVYVHVPSADTDKRRKPLFEAATATAAAAAAASRAPVPLNEAVLVAASSHQPAGGAAVAELYGWMEQQGVVEEDPIEDIEEDEDLLPSQLDSLVRVPQLSQYAPR